jgi:hypothetical protein
MTHTKDEALNRAQSAISYTILALSNGNDLTYAKACLGSALTAIKQARSAPTMQEPVCKECNGSGEIETGIGMMACTDCPPAPVAWADAEAISNLPAVDEAIRALLDDKTADNATAVVQAILGAVPPEQPAPVQPAALQKSGIANSPSDPEICNERSAQACGPVYCGDSGGYCNKCPKQKLIQAAKPCNGMNCGCIDGRSHSLECHAEHAAAIAGGMFVPSLKPAQPAPVPLTDEQINAIWNARDLPEHQSKLSAFGMDRIRAIIKAALNTPTAQQEPVAFKIYKPTPPRLAIPNVRDAELPWVYDQDPSSGNVASMWVTPVKATKPAAQPEAVQEPVASLLAAIQAEPVTLIHKWRVLELVKDHAAQPAPAPVQKEN